MHLQQPCRSARTPSRRQAMASQPARSRSRSRDDSDADPPRRDPEREQLERDLDDLERWKETGELPPGYDSREQLERDLADLSRLNDQRELPPGYSYLPPRPPPPPRRFQRSDRVVCSLGGGFGWLPGAVQSVNEPNPQDPTELFPYVVKLDPPLGKLISVPEDRKNFCRSEICFDGDVPGGAQFSIACLACVETFVDLHAIEQTQEWDHRRVDGVEPRRYRADAETTSRRWRRAPEI